MVATAVGGTPDLVEEGVTGYLVPSEDANALARALWRCYSDLSTSQAFGATARARALANFGLAGMVQRYQALFLRC